MDKTKKPHAVDVHVGMRAKARRMQLGLSQEQVGAHLGLTFQQLQKYEKGQNRLSAGRMFQLCRIYDVRPDYFFDGLDFNGHDNPTDIPAPTDAMMTTREGRAILVEFARMPLQRRGALVECAKALAS